MRKNTYKQVLLDTLRRCHGATINDLHRLVPSADPSTIYRNLEQLTDEGLVHKVIVDKGTLYELADDAHRHSHFVCSDCGDVEAIDIVRLKPSFVRTHNIRDVLIRGLCCTCKQHNV